MHVPVISSNTGGLPEVNAHGVTGFLSPVGDVDDMANNALKLLKNEQLMHQFRKNAFEHAREFDIEKVLPQYVRLYEQLLVRESAA